MRARRAQRLMVELTVTPADLKRAADEYCGGGGGGGGGGGEGVGLVERCIAPVVQCVRKSGLAMADIADVMLVGGATRMDMISERLRGLFPDAVGACVGDRERARLRALCAGRSGCEAVLCSIARVRSSVPIRCGTLP